MIGVAEAEVSAAVQPHQVLRGIKHAAYVIDDMMRVSLRTPCGHGGSHASEDAVQPAAVTAHDERIGGRCLRGQPFVGVCLLAELQDAAAAHVPSGGCHAGPVSLAEERTDSLHDGIRYQDLRTVQDDLYRILQFGYA